MDNLPTNSSNLNHNVKENQLNKKSFCKHLGLAALASLISSATLAQDTPPPLPGGLSLNGGTINLSAITGNVIHSKQTAMLRRPDVQTNIHLSVKQREELGDYLDANKPQMIRVEVTNGSAPVVSGLSGELDEKVKSILKKEQLDRLAELDLQWRGYLAVSDPKVQELLNISNDSKDKIKELMGVYCSERDAIMQRGMREQTENPDSNSVLRCQDLTDAFLSFIF